MRPELVVFDVNETLSDMRPVADRFEQVGAPAYLARTWFAGVLRDGFARALTGHPERFAELASEGLRTLLAGQPLDRDLDAAVTHVMDGFAALPVHPDVPDGVRDLERLGLRLVTLSNGAAGVAERLLTGAGVRDRFERLLTVADAGAWKPAAAAYRYALDECGVTADRAMLVAVHPWDVHGAHRAGLATAWVNRDGGRYPAYFAGADLEVTGIDALAERLRGTG